MSSDSDDEEVASNKAVDDLAARKPSTLSSVADSSEFDSDSASESDEEEEPTLKYARTPLLQDEERENASALAISSKYIAFGTHSGSIHVLAASDPSRIVKQYSPHVAAVLDLAIDGSSDEWIASASMDGHVHIAAFSADGTDESFNLGRPVRCIALEPEFGKRKNRQFVSGGMAGILTLHEKGWLGPKDTALHSGEGVIYTVQWHSHLIAWANEEGVRIYDTRTTTRIAFVPKTSNAPRPDLFKYTLTWQNNRQLLIAQGPYIKIVKLKEKKSSTLRGNSALQAEVSAIFQFDCMISGLTVFEDRYLVLAFLTSISSGPSEDEVADREMQKRKAGSRPELRLVSKDGEELSSDALSIASYERYSCNDYFLLPFPDRSSYFILSPRDLVTAQARNAIDRINWLIDLGRFEEALHVAKVLPKNQALSIDLYDLGLKHLQSLLNTKQYAKAAEQCPHILGHNSKAWEDYVFLFIERDQIQAIIPYVPLSDPQLSGVVYEMILAFLLRSNAAKLQDMLKV